MKKFLLILLSVLTMATTLWASNTPLTFTARNVYDLKVKLTIKNVTFTIQYSTDGTNWSNYTSNQEITLHSNESVSFRAQTNQSYATPFGNSYDYNSSRFTFTSSKGSVECSGNIMSLYGPSCPNLALPDRAFNYMFSGCTLLTSAPELPATDLGEYCYYRLFKGCTNLVTAPALPATTMAEGCYEGMFWDCTSLETAPVLSATTLAISCYANMFQNCTSLQTPPALPATVMKDYCYYEMFFGCTYLHPAPALPATTMAECCYKDMFYGCTYFDTPPALPATTMEKDCYSYMFSECTGLETAPALPATTLAEGCYEGMFNECSRLKTAPALPATTLAEGCYEGMFKECSSLKVNLVAPGKKWSIPAQATAADYWNLKMFEDTGGSFTGDPQIGVTYYVESDTTTETAIEVVAENMELAIAPNPVRLGEAAQITVEDGSMVEVYNMNGQCVWQKCDAAGSVNVSGLNEAGVYVVKVTKGDGRVETGKLIVE